jgi:hypothetical protein
LGDDRAIVTVHKHWQTSGAHVYTGETQERLGLARRGDDWKIVSEEETRVIATRRVR